METSQFRVSIRLCATANQLWIPNRAVLGFEPDRPQLMYGLSMDKPSQISFFSIHNLFIGSNWIGTPPINQEPRPLLEGMAS